MQAVVDCIEKDSAILEVAGGTGEISIRIASKAKHVVCTDISEKMLQVAEKKAKDISNISFKICNIYDINFDDNAFDTVIASQVLHLLDHPKAAIDELARVAKDKIILPICLLKDIKGFAKFQVNVWRLLGFKPRYTFDQEGYIKFLKKFNLNVVSSTFIEGSMPILVVVCQKDKVRL